MKHSHEFRDPIHTFITVRSDERMVIDSRPFQRLRQIHQLALTYLVYPGATHRRFEHSLGVMELATRIFDVITANQSILFASVREIIPDEDALRYWRSVIRMAALCHDIGHLPFSHAAEHKLLPSGWDHERITKDLVRSAEMSSIWAAMTPPLRSEDIVKLAVGAKKAPELQFSIWESILAEVVIGDAFGADRIDYLLRDSYHAGVQYGRFDHNRLINTLRILPRKDQGTDEPALGLEAGGMESSEALMLARHFIYKQVYLHPIRRIYDIHLIDFLAIWLDSGKFETSIEGHLGMTDAEVISAIRSCANDDTHQAQAAAKRIQNREHFRKFYVASPADKLGQVLEPGKKIYDLACDKFGADNLRHDYIPAKVSAPDFPILQYDNNIISSLASSQVLSRMPFIEVDTVYCEKSRVQEAVSWRRSIRHEALNLGDQESEQ